MQSWTRPGNIPVKEVFKTEFSFLFGVQVAQVGPLPQAAAPSRAAPRALSLAFTLSDHRLEFPPKGVECHFLFTF